MCKSMLLENKNWRGEQPFDRANAKWCADRAKLRGRGVAAAVERTTARNPPPQNQPKAMRAGIS